MLHRLFVLKIQIEKNQAQAESKRKKYSRVKGKKSYERKIETKEHKESLLRGANLSKIHEFHSC